MTSQTYSSPLFVERMMQQHMPQKMIQVFDCQPFVIDNSASILAVLTAGVSNKLIGHFGLTVDFAVDGRRQTRRMVMKVKPHGREIAAMLQGLATACGGVLAEVYPAFALRTGFAHSHGRELDVYSKLPSSLQPAVFGVFADEPNGTYLILMEYLADVTLLNSVMTPELWTDKHIRQALDQLAVWHAQHLDKPLPLNPIYWDEVPSTAYMVALSPLWDAMLHHAAGAFPDLYTTKRTRILQAVIAAIPGYWQELEVLPKTLVHNDLNPRNACFKQQDSVPVLCVYDWELATYHVPQYDVVELLCFVLDEDRYALRQTYLTYYQQALHRLTGRYADEQAFRRGFDLALFDFGLHRLGLYMMAHTIGPYPFLPRVVNSYFNMLEAAEAGQDYKS